MTAFRWKTQGDHYKEDATQGSERQEDEASHLFWSWSWSSGENSHSVKELMPQGRVIMATGLLSGVTQEGRDPPLPRHPLSAPHMPRICPCTLPSSFIWCFQERKEGLLTWKHNSPPHSTLASSTADLRPPRIVHTFALLEGAGLPSAFRHPPAGL